MYAGYVEVDHNHISFFLVQLDLFISSTLAKLKIDVLAMMFHKGEEIWL